MVLTGDTDDHTGEPSEEPEYDGGWRRPFILLIAVLGTGFLVLMVLDRFSPDVPGPAVPGPDVPSQAVPSRAPVSALR